MHSVRVKLSSNAAATGFQAALKAAANLGIYALPESQYYQRMARDLLGTVRFFALPLLIIMGIGAIFGALNTMYGAVAARVREIGTARAIGFGAFPVGAAVVAESALLALVGSVFGAAIIYLALNNLQANTNFLGNSQFAFQFVVPIPTDAGGGVGRAGDRSARRAVARDPRWAYACESGSRRAVESDRGRICKAALLLSA